jgi:hypothetical protein
MSAQSTIHPPAGLGEPPKPVRVASVFMVIVSVLYLLGALLGALGFVVGGLSILDRGDERGSGLTVTGVIIGAVAVAVLVVFLWLIARVRRGQPWARAVATVLLAVGIVLTAPGIWRSLTSDPVVIPLLAIIELGLMVAAGLLLWVPARARAYFSAGGPGVAG